MVMKIMIMMTMMIMMNDDDFCIELQGEILVHTKLTQPPNAAVNMRAMMIIGDMVITVIMMMSMTMLMIIVIMMRMMLGKPSFKKYRNFMKYFHKTVTPPALILGYLLFLNKRYDIRLTSPPHL